MTYNPHILQMPLAIPHQGSMWNPPFAVQHPGNYPVGGGNMSLQAAPIDAAIDQRTREKIIRGVYIDFSTLINNRSEDSVLVTQLSQDGEAEAQSLLVPNSNRKERITYMN